jgi:hypothetical protein
MEITTREAINKGYNMLVTGLLGFVGIGLVAEFFREPEWIDKADDIIIVGLAIFGGIWYFTGRNRNKFSWLPIALLTISTLVKIGAVINEFSDKVAVGDDLGLVIPMVFMTIIAGISLIRYYRSIRMLVMPSTPEMMTPGD